jgi:hypothetical protein
MLIVTYILLTFYKYNTIQFKLTENNGKLFVWNYAPVSDDKSTLKLLKSALKRRHTLLFGFQQVKLEFSKSRV